MTLRHYVGVLAGLAALLFILAHLVIIAITGRAMLIIEPNPWIRWGEIVLTGGAVLLLLGVLKRAKEVDNVS